MPQPAVRIEGDKDLRRKLRQLDKAADNNAAMGALKAVHQEASEVVLEKALALVPVRTGRLKNSLRAAATQRSGRVRAGFKRVPYAGPIHFGWPERRIAPQPFLYDALDWRREEVIKTYEYGLEQLKKKYRL